MGMRQSKRASIFSHLLKGFGAAGRLASQARYPQTWGLERFEDRLLLSVAQDLVTFQWNGAPVVAQNHQWVMDLPAGTDFFQLAAKTGLPFSGAKSLSADGAFVAFTVPTWNSAQVASWYGENRAKIVSLSPDAVLVKTSTLPNEATLDPVDWAAMWQLQNVGQTIAGQGGLAGADISATKAWDITTGSHDVVVAVLDTGIQFNIGNPTGPIDTVPNLWLNKKEAAFGFGVADGVDHDLNGIANDVFGANFGVAPATGIFQGADPVGHGTFVASEIGAVGNNAVGVNGFTGQNPGVGVAWSTQIMDMQLDLLQGNTTLVSEVVNAINYVVVEKRVYGYNVVAMNMSFGDIFFGTPISNPAMGTLNDAISVAGKAGIITVAAAGNSGLNNDTFPAFPANVPNPYVISVAATDNRDQLSPFSDYGANTVDLAAPGVDVGGLDVNGALTTMSGTSMAAPLVTGTIALMASANPTATAGQIVSALLSSVDVLPQLKGKVVTGGRLNAYKAVEAILGDKAPTAYIDTLNPQQVVGWAFDGNAGKAPAFMSISIDGVALPDLAANIDREDLLTVFGSANHGFSFKLPSMSPGLHTINIYVYNTKQDGSLGNKVLLTSQTLNTALPPKGSIDGADSNNIVGWVWDPNDGAAATTVKVVIDGATTSTFLANLARPDLVAYVGSPNHGFNFALPSTLPPGPHRVDIFGIDNPTAVPYLIGSEQIVKNVAPTTYVDIFNQSQIVGWSVDMDDPTKFVQLQVSIDGAPSALLQADGYRPDLVSVVGEGGLVYHCFSFVMPPLSAAPHTVTLYAVDVNTGVATAVFQQQVIGNQPPIGSLDPTANQFVGWGWDIDHPDVPLTVRVDIDNNITGTPVLANIPRADLAAYLHSANHGFVVNIPELTTGAHTVRLYAYDPDTMVPTLVSTRVINTNEFGNGNLRPYGNVDALNAFGVQGWVFDPNSASAPVYVRVDVDGAPVTQALAGINRPDLGSPIVGTYHGFEIPLPALSAGAHKVDVYAIDSTSTIPVLIKSDFVNQIPPTGFFDTATTASLMGWAQDFSSVGNPTLRLDIDGVPGNVFSADFVRGDGLPGFLVGTPGLTPGPHTVSLYVMEGGSDNAVLVAQRVISAKDPLRGYVDVLNKDYVTGWAFDATAGANPVSIVISIDGVDAVNITANELRTDLNPVVGSPNHGFTYYLANHIAAGNHTITVRAIDPITGLGVLLASRNLVFA